MHECSRIIIKKILERHGVPRRDNADANRLKAKFACALKRAACRLTSAAAIASADE